MNNHALKKKIKSGVNWPWVRDLVLREGHFSVSVCDSVSQAVPEV